MLTLDQIHAAMVADHKVQSFTIFRSGSCHILTTVGLFQYESPAQLEHALAPAPAARAEAPSTINHQPSTNP